MNRGELYDVELPGGRRPVVVLTHDVAIPVLANLTVAAVTATIRDLPTEVPVGAHEGLARDSVINCDNLFTVPKSSLGRRRGRLGPESLARLRSALMIALDLDRPVTDV